ncbi:FAD-dependent oxidoreductase [Actinopolymorpha sp. B9G3]|uniref:FAD-dependent oxidoreductase n=1 Tax=Actinopolymorpha sp. B9G3 TaxID=3158970 RepID=UPI0032D9A814
MTEEAHDVAVVGAGPAGLTAATTMAGHGLRVVLLDAGGRPGGQFFRHRDDAAADAHGPGFRALRSTLAAEVAAGRLTYRPRHQVWTVERAARRFTVHALDESGDGEPRPCRAEADTLVVATGAYDRQLPFPGWDLPGVVAAGGAQALLKGSGVLVGKRVVVAGSGPFLLPVAAGLAEGGARVVGVYEASRMRGYLEHVRAVARHPARLAEAASYAARLARHRVPYRTGHAVVAAYGDASLTGVTVARLDAQRRPIRGTESAVPGDALAVGFGFTPHVDLLVELGCELSGDHAGGSPVVAVDLDQRTTVEGAYSAGETTGIGGAALAQVEGELAGLAVAAAHGIAVDERQVRRLRTRRAGLRAFAAVLDQVHAPPDGWTAGLPDDTLVCRCEEVTAGTVRRAVRELGATDPRSVKLLTRTGMGWCQGRICTAATVELTAALTSRPVAVEDTIALARRPFAHPVPLGVLADLDVPDPEPRSEQT